MNPNLRWKMTLSCRKKIKFEDTVFPDEVLLPPFCLHTSTTRARVQISKGWNNYFNPNQMSWKGDLWTEKRLMVQLTPNLPPNTWWYTRYMSENMTNKMWQFWHGISLQNCQFYFQEHNESLWKGQKWKDQSFLIRIWLFMLISDQALFCATRVCAFWCIPILDCLPFNSMAQADGKCAVLILHEVHVGFFCIVHFLCEDVVCHTFGVRL